MKKLIGFPVFCMGIVCLLSVTLSQSHGVDWTNWDTLRPGDTKVADGKFSPDQKLQILFSEESGPSSSAPLDLILATFHSGRFTFTNVARIGPGTDDAREQDLRLIGDS